MQVVSPPAYELAGAFTYVEAIDELVKDARERVARLDGVQPNAVYGLPAEELALYLQRHA